MNKNRLEQRYKRRRDYPQLAKIYELVDNIIEEARLTYPFIRITKGMVMKKVGYDRSYLYPSKYKILSTFIYDRLYKRLKEIDIDEMVGQLFYFKFNKRGEKKSK